MQLTAGGRQVRVERQWLRTRSAIPTLFLGREAEIQLALSPESLPGQRFPGSIPGGGQECHPSRTDREVPAEAGKAPVYAAFSAANCSAAPPAFSVRISFTSARERARRRRPGKRRNLNRLRHLSSRSDAVRDSGEAQVPTRPSIK
jgi:hypothetical protein